jgi:hypothetical protein
MWPSGDRKKKEQETKRQKKKAPKRPKSRKPFSYSLSKNENRISTNPSQESLAPFW